LKIRPIPAKATWMDWEEDGQAYRICRASVKTSISGWDPALAAETT